MIELNGKYNSAEVFTDYIEQTHQNNHKSSTAPCYTDDDPYDTEDDIFYVRDFFPDELLF